MTDAALVDVHAAPDQPETVSTRTALKVLVVDDDSFQLALMTEVLHELGVRDVITASSGPMALDKLGAHPQDVNLLLLDLHMPDMDGFQFMETLAAVGFTGGLIIVSGQCDAVLRAASQVAKLRRFSLLGSVSKPVGITALSALI